MQHHNSRSGYLQAAAGGGMIGILGLTMLSVASGALGMLMAGWGCLVLPFIVLVGASIGSLGGIAYHWYQTSMAQK
jgi:hypothetical protein